MKAINAEVLKDKKKKLEAKEFKNGWREYVQGWNECIDMIMNEPELDIRVRPKALWIPKYSDKDGHVLMCEHCGNMTKELLGSSYCPNCGATML